MRAVRSAAELCTADVTVHTLPGALQPADCSKFLKNHLNIDKY